MTKCPQGHEGDSGVKIKSRQMRTKRTWRTGLMKLNDSPCKAKCAMSTQTSDYLKILELLLPPFTVKAV